MNDRLRLTGTTPPSVPPRLPPGALRVRGRIAEAMLAAHALAPEDAVDFAPDPRDVAAFGKLRDAGIVREVPGGRFWFDLVAYHLREQALGRTRAIWGFGVALIVGIFVLLLYR